MRKPKPQKVRNPTPAAAYMVTSGLFHSRQVPNRKRQADRQACRRPERDA